MGENLEETQQRVGVQSSLLSARLQMAGVSGRLVCTGSFILHWTNCGGPRAQTSCAYCHSGLHGWFHQAPELGDVVVEPLEECLNRLRAAGMCTNIWWKLQKQLPGRRQAGQSWVDNFTSASVDKLGFTRCVSAPQFFWNPDRQVEDGGAHG